MKYVDVTLPGPAANLACDEALLDLCEEGASDEILRFWEPEEYFVVVGYANRTALEVNMAACRERNIPVLRRCSGGGTVLQGPGCLNYSVILKMTEGTPLQTITGANSYILHKNQEAVAKLAGCKVELQGQTDLSINGLKFSGNAQRRKKDYLIFHGTLLLHFDIALIETILPMPSKEPEYRKSRSHSDFLMNLKISPMELKSALQTIWHANEPLIELPVNHINELATTRYSTDDWNLKF